MQFRATAISKAVFCQKKFASQIKHFLAQKTNTTKVQNINRTLNEPQYVDVRQINLKKKKKILTKS